MEMRGAKIELLDESTWVLSIWAETVEPVLVFTPLEYVGVEVDPHKQTREQAAGSRLKEIEPGSNPLFSRINPAL